MATEAEVKDPITATIKEVEDKEIISDLTNTIINKIVTEEKEKVESWTSQPSETVTVLPRTDEGQVINVVENEKVEIDDVGHTGSTVGEPFLQPPPVVTGLLKKDTGEIQWSLKQGTHSWQEENYGISNDGIVSVGGGKTETSRQEENSGEGQILVQGNEPTEEITESSKTGAAQQTQEIIESPYAEINTNTVKEESVDHSIEVINEASRINNKITDDINKIPPEEQDSLPTANMDEKARIELTHFPNEEAVQLKGVDHDKVPTNSKGQADETFEVHQEEKHGQVNNEADTGPEGSEKIEMTPSTKDTVYGFNEDPEQQEKAPNTEIETATVGIERYQANIEVETNAIKELDPSIVLEEEDDRRFKLPITTEKEGREPNITGQASDKEFTEKVEAMAPNYETLSEDLNKQSHLVTSEGKIISQERSLDDGKPSDPEVSKDEIEQPNASKDEKPLDILEEEEELSNMAPERDKTGNNMSVKDDQLQFEGCSITVADNEEAVFEKHVFASSSSKEAIEIEKRAELDAEAQDYASEAETGSRNTVTEKVIPYTEGLHIPPEQKIESLDNSRELKFVAGSLANDDDINTTERINLEESYNYQTGSREEPTVQDNKGVENDTNEDIQSSSVAQEELGKAEEETLTEEATERLDEVDENELHKENTQKEENTEDLHVMEEVNETLEKATVPDSTTLHDHEANYFDSGFSENKITEDLGQHAEALSMSTEFEKESLEAVEKPGDLATRTSDAAEEKIKDEKAEQDIKYDANDDDAPTLIIEETFLTEAQFDHYSVKETDAISCEKHENVTIERSSSLVSQPLVGEHELVDVDDTSDEISDANIAEVEEKSIEAFPCQTAPGVDKVKEIEKVSKPQCQDFERAADVETPPAHETGLLKVDENSKNGANDMADKCTNIEDYSADLEVVHAIESPIVLAESKNVEKEISEKFVKDNVEQEESETDNRVPERSLEDLRGQCAQDVGVDEMKEIEKGSEPQRQDFERFDDAQTPIAYETDLFHVDPKDEDDTANKVVNIDDYVADFDVVPAIESPLALEESKRATLEKLKDKAELKEGEVAPGSDDKIQERSLEALTGQTAQGVDEVENIEKILESQGQDLEIVADDETLDVQTPHARETGQLRVDEDPKDGYDQSTDKGLNIDDYIADLEVVPAIESPLELEESKRETLDKLKDKVEQKEGEVAPGSDKIKEKSLEALTGQSAQEVDEVEKISELQSQDLEILADVQTPLARETGQLDVDEEHNDKDDQSVNKSVNINDYVADLEVVPTIVSPIELEESKQETLEKLVEDKVDPEESEIAPESDQVQESSPEAFPGQIAPVVDNVEEIEKISEPQCEDSERAVYVETPLAQETGLLQVDGEPKDGEIIGENSDYYVADAKVVPTTESSVSLAESENAEKENPEKFKDEAELKEGEIAPGLDDQIQERSFEALTEQSAEAIDEVEKISELQGPDLEIVDDVQTPLVRETEELHVDEHPKDLDYQIENKDVIIDDYVADLEVVPTIVSPLELEESKKATLEKLVEDKVDPEESEIAPESDQVQENSLEAFPGQTATEVDNVEEIEKISGPQCEDFERVVYVEALDVQTPLAHETELLQVDEEPKDGEIDTASKGENSDYYVADVKVVSTTESPLSLTESKNAEKENPEKFKDEVELKEEETAPGLEDQIQERSVEALSDQSAQAVDEVEKISELQVPDLEIVADVQTPLVRETEELRVDEHPKDLDYQSANKGVTIDNYVADLEMIPTIVSPLEVEESKKATLEKLVEDKVDQEESEMTPESDLVEESSLEAFQGQTVPEVVHVEEIEKISETQCEDFGRVINVEARDVQTPLAHETGLLQVDEEPKDGEIDTASKGENLDYYVADVKVVPTTETPLSLAECKNTEKENPEKFKHEVELKEGEIAPGLEDQIQERSLEALTDQSAEAVEEVEKISELQGPDLEIVPDVETPYVQTPHVRETEELHVDEHPKDLDYESSNKGVIIDNYVADLEVVPTIVSPLELEESKKATLENLVEDKVDPEESEIAPESVQVEESSLEAFPGQTAPEVDNVEEIEKISEPQSEDFEGVVNVETLDVQTPLAHETGLLEVDEEPKDGEIDTASKDENSDYYVADVKVISTTESPLSLAESNNAEKEHPEMFKDEVELKEGEAPGLDDQIQERSLEALTDQSAQGVDEVEKRSESQGPDIEIVADVETLDVQTPLVRETEEFHVDEHPKDLDYQSANKGVITDDYVADLEVVPTIVSPLVLEESKKATLEKLVEDKVDPEESEIAPESDQVQESSLEAFPGQTVPEVDNVEEIEKISETQCEDFERAVDVETLDVQTPLAHETGLLKVDEETKDGEIDIASKGENSNYYVADVKVIPSTESPLSLAESNNAEKENTEKFKDEVELKKGEIAPGIDDQIQKRSLEAVTDQSAQGVNEVEKIEKISESQGPDIEIVADVETLDVETILIHETEELHVNEHPKELDDQIANKGGFIDDNVADLEVVPTIVSPLELEESKKATLEKLVEDKVDPEEIETAPESVQVQESSLEAFQGQTALEVDNVEEIEKISEPQCVDFARVVNVETLDVQTPLGHETGLLQVDEEPKDGEIDTESKGVNSNDYVADIKVVPTTESPLSLAESKNAENENAEQFKEKDELKEGEIAPGLEDQIQERSLEALTDQSAQGVNEVEKIEKISESQGPDHEIVADIESLDVETTLISETEEIHVNEHPKDLDDQSANKGVIADLEMVPTIVSPLELEESKKVTVERLVEDKADPEESEIAPESDQVQESSLEAFPGQTAPEVEKVEEIEKISERQCEDSERAVYVETPLAQEAGLLQVDGEPKDGEIDTASKGENSDYYVADVKVVPTKESSVSLVESENAEKENPEKFKDEVELKEGEITPGLDDQIQERSLEALTDQSAQAIDDVEKISELQGPDLEIVADVQTTLVRETEELHVDEHPKDLDYQSANKGVIIDDYVTDFEVVPTIVSPLELEESKKATLEKLVEDKLEPEESEIAPESDQVQESSLEAFPGQTAPEVDNVEEIEKISEPQCEDSERAVCVETPLAHETGLLQVDGEPKDGENDTASKGENSDYYEADVKVVPITETSVSLVESENAEKENPEKFKDEVELKDGEIAPGLDDQIQERSLEALTDQSAQAIDDVEKISEFQGPDLEIVADVQTPLVLETEELHVDKHPKDLDYQSANKGVIIDDYVTDLDVVPTIVSPLELEGSKKAALEKLVEDKLDPEESEISPESDQVQESSLEAFPGQTAPEVDNVEEIEKISEPQCEDSERAVYVETPLAHETGLLQVDGQPKDGEIKGENSDYYVADVKVVPTTESSVSLVESENAEKENPEKFKDEVELKEGEIAPGLDDQIQERSLEALTLQSAQAIDDVEKISELQGPDLEIVADVQTPLVLETEKLHVNEHTKDLDYQSANKGVIIDDYVTDLEVVPTIVSPLELEESKATLEKFVEEKLDPEESEIAPESDQVQESSLEAFPGQTAPEVDNVEEIEKTSEPQCEDSERAVYVETPLAHETGLLQVDGEPKDGEIDTASKGENSDCYAADVKVVPTKESSVLLVESENAEKENPEQFKDEVELKEGKIAPGLDDQIQERSLEALTDQSAQAIDDVEKISELQGPELEIVADVQTLDVQTPLVRETEELHVEEHPKDLDYESANKGVIIDDYVTDLEVVPTIVSPLELEESKKATLEKLVEDKLDPEESEIAPESDQVQESSLEAFPGQTAPEVDNVEEIEKISEPQCEDYERVVNVETLDVETPLAHETGLLQVDGEPKDGENDTASKSENTEYYVADVKVVPTTESPLLLAESKNAEKENPEKFKDEVELKEGEIAPGLEDQIQERSLEALPDQSAQAVDEVEKISELQGPVLELVADVETPNVQTPLVRETEELHVDEHPKDLDYQSANKCVIIDNYVADLEVVSTIVSPLELEESKKATLEKLVEDMVDPEESEIAPESDQVQERPLETFPSQSAQGVDDVGDFEKISEPECQDFKRVHDAETFDVQTLPAHETGLLQIDEDPKDGENDTTNEVVNLEDDVTDLKVVPAIESQFLLVENKNAEKDNPVKFDKDNVEQEEKSEITFETDDRVPERSLEDFPVQSAEDVGVDEVKKIEEITEQQCQNFERVDDVQTPIAHETELLHVDPKDREDDTANKDVNKEDYGADLVVVPAIESGFNDQVPERSHEALPGQNAQGVDEVEEIEKISEAQYQERVADTETFDVQTPPVHETGLLVVDEDPKDGDEESASNVLNTHDYVADLKQVPTIETPLASDVETLYVETLPTHETRLLPAIESSVPLEECNNATVEKIVKYEAELEESKLASESNEHVLERPIEGDEVHGIQSITEPQVQDSERISRETVDVQAPPSREGLLEENFKDGDETENKAEKEEREMILETATIIKKIEIHDGQKEGTDTEGGNGETNEDVEKKSETQVQDVERFATSEDSSNINVGTSPQYETGLRANVVSQEEENETATIIEKIEIQDGEKETFQGICEQGTVTKGGDGETREDVEKKFESQFQNVERVATSENSSIINVGTSPQYESGLQMNVVRPKEENETTVTEKIEIQDGEKEAFLGICEQGTVTEGGYEETSEDVGKKIETPFQDVERVTNSEDASITNVGTSPQYETGVQVNVVSPKEEDETTTITEKIEIQDGEKESFNWDKDVCTNQDTKEPISVEDKSVRGTYNEERALVNPMEDNERDKDVTSALVILDQQTGGGDTEVSIKPAEVLTKESFERSKDVSTNQDNKELFTAEDKVITETYHEERALVNPMEENKRDKDVKSSPVTLDLQTGDHDTEVSTKPPEVLTKESFEQSKDVCTNQDTKELVTVEDKVVTETYHEERAFVNPMEENERDKDVKSSPVTLDLQTGDHDTEVSTKQPEVLTKESFEQSKDFSTNQDNKELFTAEDKVAAETYHEERALVNPMEENKRDKDVKSSPVTLDLQTGDHDTEVSTKPPEVLTKESFEQSKDVCTNQDTKELVTVEDKVVTETYHEERAFVNPMEENERDKDVTSALVTLDQQTGGGDTEVSIKPAEVLSKESFEQSKDVSTNQDNKELFTAEDKVVAETYHEERAFVNPMEEIKRDKDVTSALVTLDLQTGGGDTEVSIKPAEVLTKESFEGTKDVSTNQDTKELFTAEDKVVTETYHEERALVNPMGENKRDKDVESDIATLDLQAGDDDTEVSIEPTEVLTKEEPVELSTMENEGKLKETKTDSNKLIGNDEENENQIKKSIDSPHAKNSSTDLLNEERNVDKEYEEVKESFTILEPTKLSLSDLMQKSMRKAPQVTDESIQKKELIGDNKEEKSEGTQIKHVEEAKTDEEIDEGDEHKGQDSGSDAPVMVEASRDIEIKHTPKKSHNILSGVGSKVKHSIAKVKKVITGKSSPHPKPPSPRIDK